MKRPKLEYYGKPKMTDEGVEAFIPVKDIMRFVKDLEEYCDQLEQINENSDIHSVRESFVVSAKFSPFYNKWTGLGVEMGVEGTHKEYNVVYNGDCINERFDTEQEAKQAVLNAL